MDVESNFIEIEYSSKVAKYLLLVYLPCQASKVEEISVAVKGLNLSKKKKKKKKGKNEKRCCIWNNERAREKREGEWRSYNPQRVIKSDQLPQNVQSLSDREVSDPI